MDLNTAIDRANVLINRDVILVRLRDTFADAAKDANDARLAPLRDIAAVHGANLVVIAEEVREAEEILSAAAAWKKEKGAFEAFLEPLIESARAVDDGKSVGIRVEWSKYDALLRDLKKIEGGPLVAKIGL